MNQDLDRIESSISKAESQSAVITATNERIIAEMKLLMANPLIKQVVSPYENGTVLD